MANAVLRCTCVLLGWQLLALAAHTVHVSRACNVLLCACVLPWWLFYRACCTMEHASCVPAPYCSVHGSCLGGVCSCWLHVWCMPVAYLQSSAAQTIGSQQLPKPAVRDLTTSKGRLMAEPRTHVPYQQSAGKKNSYNTYLPKFPWSELARRASIYYSRCITFYACFLPLDELVERVRSLEIHIIRTVARHGSP